MSHIYQYCLPSLSLTSMPAPHLVPCFHAQFSFFTLRVVFTGAARPACACTALARGVVRITVHRKDGSQPRISASGHCGEKGPGSTGTRGTHTHFILPLLTCCLDTTLSAMYSWVSFSSGLCAFSRSLHSFVQSPCLSQHTYSFGWVYVHCPRLCP